MKRQVILTYDPATQMIEYRVIRLDGSGEHIVATLPATSPPPDADE